MSFFDFLYEVTHNLPLAITVLLILGVILVNGWTDAPNAIATCVSTRAISAKNAIVMAAICNFLGVLVGSVTASKVGATIYNMVNFNGDSRAALIALCASLFAIVLWATAAWAFGIPTSESHALIAGISGAAIALQGNISGINGAEWVKVIYGLGMSTVLGFGLGFVVVKIIELIFNRANRKYTNVVFKNGQVLAGGMMAFMHGMQDGLKFIGVFMLGLALVQGDAVTNDFTNIPFWLIVLCSVIMGLGTSIGGYKIIKTVGMGMVKLDTYQGFAADTAASICLWLASSTGVPVSTTHTKTTSIMGVGASKRMSAVNWSVVLEMVYAWVLTFPGCGLVGFLMAKLFLNFFQ